MRGCTEGDTSPAPHLGCIDILSLVAVHAPGPAWGRLTEHGPFALHTSDPHPCCPSYTPMERARRWCRGVSSSIPGETRTSG